MKEEHSKKQRIHTLGIIGLILVCVATIGFGVVTLSKYVLDWDDKQVSIPEGFYFESDYLQYVANDDDIPSYTIYTDSVDITVRNHNYIDVAEDDITYSITYEVMEPEDSEADESNQAILTDEDETVTSDSKPFILYNATNIEKDSDTFTLSYRTTGSVYDSPDQVDATIISVKVTATSSDPYAKTITAIFDFKMANEETFYRITWKDYYMQLELFTGLTIDEDSKITISYDGLAPDNTNDFMDDWLTVENERILTGLSRYGYYKFAFFKANLEELSTDDMGDKILTLTESDGVMSGSISIPYDTVSSTDAETETDTSETLEND